MMEIKEVYWLMEGKDEMSEGGGSRPCMVVGEEQGGPVFVMVFTMQKWICREESRGV